jgi:hypothetical protein
MNFANNPDTVSEGKVGNYQSWKTPPGVTRQNRLIPEFVVAHDDEEHKKCPQRRFIVASPNYASKTTDGVINPRYAHDFESPQ